MTNITSHLLSKLTPSEVKYSFDEQVGIHYLTGNLEFVLHTVLSRFDWENKQEIESQYVLDIIDELELWNGEEQIEFEYDSDELYKVFEI